MYVLSILIISTTKRDSEHTNSQYFLAWMYPCMAIFAKRLVFHASVFVHNMTWKGIEFCQNYPSRFLFQIKNWPRKEIIHININISRQKTFAQKKVSSLFSSRLFLHVACADWLLFLRILPNSSCSSHGVRKIPSSSLKSRLRTKSFGLKCIEHINELLDGSLSLFTFRFHEIDSSLSSFLHFKTIIPK